MILEEKELLSDRMHKIEQLKMLQLLYQEELRRLSSEHPQSLEEHKEEEEQKEMETESSN
jgi:hypothetical protein